MFIANMLTKQSIIRPSSNYLNKLNTYKCKHKLGNILSGVNFIHRWPTSLSHCQPASLLHFVYRPACLPACPTTNLSSCLLLICLPAYPPACLTVNLSIRLFDCKPSHPLICLPAYPSAYLSASLPTRLHVCQLTNRLSVCQPTYLPIVCLPNYLPICLSLFLPTSLYVFEPTHPIIRLPTYLSPTRLSISRYVYLSGHIYCHWV